MKIKSLSTKGFGKFNSDRRNYQPNFYYNGAETIIESQVINAQETPIDITISSFLRSVPLKSLQL